MRAGSTDFMQMLAKGKPCASKSISIVLNETFIKEWVKSKRNHETSDFMTSINNLVEEAAEYLE